MFSDTRNVYEQNKTGSCDRVNGEKWANIRCSQGRAI